MPGTEVHTDTPTLTVERLDKHRRISKEGTITLGSLWGSDEEPDRASFFDMLLRAGRLAITDKWVPRNRKPMTWEHREQILEKERERYETGYYMGIGGPDS